jgi:hypothetical protein
VDDFAIAGNGIDAVGVDGVVPFAAVDPVALTVAGPDRVVAAPAGDAVVAGAADQDVG